MSNRPRIRKKRSKSARRKFHRNPGRKPSEEPVVYNLPAPREAAPLLDDAITKLDDYLAHLPKDEVVVRRCVEEASHHAVESGETAMKLVERFGPDVATLQILQAHKWVDLLFKQLVALREARVIPSV